MARDYVRHREAGYYIVGSRVPLPMLVHEYRNGASPESIRQSFPTLTLEQVHGALAYYLRHKAEVDASIRKDEVVTKEFRTNNPPPEALHLKLERARQQSGRGG